MHSQAICGAIFGKKRPRYSKYEMQIRMLARQDGIEFQIYSLGIIASTIFALRYEVAHLSIAHTLISNNSALQHRTVAPSRGKFARTQEHATVGNGERDDVKIR